PASCRAISRPKRRLVISTLADIATSIKVACPVARAGALNTGLAAHYSTIPGTKMMTTARSWFEDNQALAIFLVAQAIAIGAVAISIIAYSVKLETRVVTLEVRGSPHLAEINNRLTVLEKQTEANKQSIDRIVDVMTKNLSVNPTK